MIGTWKVGMTLDNSKLVQVARKMNTYKLEIQGLAATRWAGSGDEYLQSSQYFSDNNAERVNSVGIMISGKLF